jgi:antitoxin component YwqK of YwqJK toxin-antitoxin module
MESGLSKQWDDEGRLLMELTYSGGLQHGLYREYVNGQLKVEGSHKNGPRDGLWVEYHEEECLYRERVYDSGKLISETGWMEKMVKALR